MADKKAKAVPKTQSLGITQEVAEKLRLIKAIKGPNYVDEFIADVVDREHARAVGGLQKSSEPSA